MQVVFKQCITSSFWSSATYWTAGKEMKRSEIRFPAKCKVRKAVAKSNMHSIQSVSKGSDGAGVDFREDLVLKLCPD